MDHQRRFDLGHICRIRLSAIERDRGREVREGHGQRIADAPAVAEADRAHLAGRVDG